MGIAGFHTSHGLVEVDGGVRSEVALAEAWSARAMTSVIVAHGQGAVRDLWVTAGFAPVRRDDLRIRLHLGPWLPTGGSLSGGIAMPGTTGSVDPGFGVEVVGGGKWVVAAQGLGRTPLVRGRDGVRQGAFFRSDLTLARRLGVAVPFVGVSGLAGTSDETGFGQFTELAAVAGGAFTVSDRVGLTATARLPVLAEPIPPYQLAVSAGVTWVIGPPKKKGEGGESEH